MPGLGGAELHPLGHKEHTDIMEYGSAFGFDGADPAMQLVAKADGFGPLNHLDPVEDAAAHVARALEGIAPLARSEEHTSELQSLMRISYAVFCLKKKKKHPLYYNQQYHKQSRR